MKLRTIFTLALSIVMISSMALAKSPVLKQYKEKSGKITFEHKKFKTVMTMKKTAGGTMESVREMQPYVEKVSEFTWDNYGNIAYEVIYQVSGFGGKPLPEKLKIHEKLWKGDRIYTFNVKNQKQTFSKNWEKPKCEQNKKECKSKGLFGAMYPNLKATGKGKVAGKAVTLYKESESADYNVWQGMIVKYANYSTKRKNKKYLRSDISRVIEAVKIDTKSKIDKNIFKPSWLKEN